MFSTIRDGNDGDGDIDIDGACEDKRLLFGDG